MTDFYARHEALLQKALDAIAERTYFSAYPESASPKLYGDTAKADGDAAFEALLGKPFPFDDGHPNERLVGGETSPYGKALGVRYPTASVETLVAASAAAGEAWGKASVEARAGVLLEALSRLNRQSFLIADAVQHTSGQSWGMAFQAGGPHAQDRGLEAVAYAVAEMRRAPRAVTWEKPQGKGEPIRLEKTYPHRPARDRGRDRLRDLPDLEPLSRPVREPRHRQQRDRQAASRPRSCRPRSRSRSSARF